jgi:hypothetical protein
MILVVSAQVVLQDILQILIKIVKEHALGVLTLMVVMMMVMEKMIV